MAPLVCVSEGVCMLMCVSVCVPKLFRLREMKFDFPEDQGTVTSRREHGCSTGRNSRMLLHCMESSFQDEGKPEVKQNCSS